MNKTWNRLAVKEKTAAEMFDMTAENFRELVSSGAFPSPETFGRHKRWIVSDLEAILSGAASRPSEVFSL